MAESGPPQPVKIDLNKYKKGPQTQGQQQFQPQQSVPDMPRKFTAQEREEIRRQELKAMKDQRAHDKVDFSYLDMFEE